MWVKKALQFALFIVLAAVAFAEPPAAYGPPGFASGFRPTGFGGFRGFQSGFQANAFQGGYQTGGYKNVYQEAPQPFSFQYEVKDPQSGNDFGHHANSDGRRVSGQYHVLLPDGRRQIVKYVADDNGYNADVQYEGQAQTFHGGYQQGGYQQGGYKHGGYQHGGFSSGGFGGFKGGFAGYNY